MKLPWSADESSAKQLFELRRVFFTSCLLLLGMILLVGCAIQDVGVPAKQTIRPHESMATRKKNAPALPTLRWNGRKIDRVIGYQFEDDENVSSQVSLLSPPISTSDLFNDSGIDQKRLSTLKPEPSASVDFIYNQEALSRRKLKEAVLNPAQTQELFDAVYNAPDGTSDIYDCYHPHHIFILYHQDTLVGVIEVCFTCNNLRTQPEFAFPQDPNFPRLAALSKRLGLGAPGYEDDETATNTKP